jgi:hypothetical protein
MLFLAIRMEHPLDVTVQCADDPDAREHRRAVLVDDQKQGLDRILPFLDLLFGLRQLLDISGGILEGDELALARQRDRIFELRFQPRLLMTPSLLVEFGFKAFRHSRC